MSGHTAGLWSVLRGNETWIGGVVISDEQGNHVATALRGIYNAEANAAFIVRACNSHEELLAALKELASWDLHSLCFDGTRAKNAAESLANVRRFAQNALLTAEGRE